MRLQCPIRQARLAASRFNANFVDADSVRALTIQIHSYLDKARARSFLGIRSTTADFGGLLYPGPVTRFFSSYFNSRSVCSFRPTSRQVWHPGFEPGITFDVSYTPTMQSRLEVCDV